MLLTLQLVFILINIATSAILEPAIHNVNGFKELGPSNPDINIKLYFFLRNTNINKLRNLFLSVSTPGNDQYGNHKSIPELHTLIAPTDTSINSIINFLSNYSNNINIESTNKDVISITTTISKAETLLNCTYFDYQSITDKSQIISRVKIGTTYKLNHNIAQHLYFISPTIYFPNKNVIFPTIAPASNKITPLQLRALYNVGTTSGLSNNNTQAIASFETEYYDISDLHIMWQTYNISTCNVTNIPSNSTSGNALEAELDTQYISSLGESIPLQVWLTQGKKFLDDLYQFTENVLNSTNPPDLFSISYGVDESDVSGSYINKLNNQFMLMGAAGISVLFASGDKGAGGGCTGTEPFEPTWPGSSPYVTAVGGVFGGNIGESPTGEQTWPYGGGGFSNIEQIQSWQSDAVSYYLMNERNLPQNGKFNKSGRGYPDISAQSVQFEIYVKGKVEVVSGTSCAAPTAGGIFALLNDLRKQNGMSNLGFLNPFIYQTAAKDLSAFNDVVKGTNYGCAQSIGFDLGFEAYEKWDPTSGMGTPNYDKLKTYVMQTGQQTLKYN
eukprot:449953_1